MHEVLQDVVPQSVIDKGNRNKSWKYGYNEEYDFVCISKDGTLGNIIDPTSQDATSLKELEMIFGF